MKVYIAAPYGARAQAQWCAAHLTGHEVTSSWLGGTRPVDESTTCTAPALSDEQAARYAERDLADVARSDVLILLTASIAQISAGGAASGGRHVEVGYALALGKPVIVVGEPENLFHRSRLVYLAQTWEAAKFLLTNGDEETD